MSLALVHSRARVGMAAPEVTVEVHLGGGLPRMSIVGLPEAAVREAKDRVRAAIQCAQFEFPARAITVNLAPADLPKHGGRFDLPIALGILAASGQVPVAALRGREFLGELGLTGTLRAVDGVLPAALASSAAGRRLVVPETNGEEAALARESRTHTARTLSEVCAMLQDRRAWTPAVAGQRNDTVDVPDLADVRGQAQARRALEIAAAGGHHLLLSGSPGCGKSLLAARLPGLLPPMDEKDALETATLASISGHGAMLRAWQRRPFRSPHHSSSAVALVGGGSEPRPGEISLAHNGVLFLDEFTEWNRQAIESLREPLETGRIHLARAARRIDYPARFQLVAAMNPCPCGWAGDPSGRCECLPDVIRRYRGKVTGPILDRIDLHVQVPRLPAADLRPDAPPGEATSTVRARVIAARERQHKRAGTCNARLDPAVLARDCRLHATDQALLETAADRLQLSARAVHRVLRVARTIADLEGAAAIATAHLAEALAYRATPA